MRMTLEIEAPGRGAPEDPLAADLSRTAGGDESALARLYDATSAQVFGWTLRILRDRQEAEEATVDVFSQVWRQARSYDASRGTVSAWILTLARSRAIDHLRSRQRRGRHEGPAERLDAVADGGADPLSATVGADRAARVRKALLALPADQRKVIEAAFFGGLSHTEVAEALGQPLGTVKTRIRNGLATLRRTLAGMQAEEGWA
jgi:RNA polymerase sigma-70 factor (ECF subfamily)